MALTSQNYSAFVNRPHKTMKLPKWSLAIPLFLSSIHAAADVQKLQSIPLPENISSQSVALNVIQHGHRMSMATLQGIDSIEPVLSHLRESWNTGDNDLPGYVEETAGDWSIISRIEDGWNHVVQLRSTNQNIQAYVSVMELEPVKDWSYKPVMPRGGVLVSSTTGKEFGKATQTDILFSKQRQGEVAGFYRGHFDRDGWAIVSDKTIEGSTALLAQRRGKQAEIVVTPVQNGSVAVINQVGTE